ncbi:MAG TPA: hypothetical protein VFB96_00505 [Pirellulaceae bacterium]|nr:hypothetical protein [Pirellulaceae bacterium]
MSLLWRMLSSSALVAGIVLAFSGCKSGGGIWTPGWGKLGSSSSASDLAVSRPTTKVPKPSSDATPSTPGSLASSSSAPGTQNGPYGSSSERTSTPGSTYGSRPAAWQGEPHSSVAPAGGYQTGGPYNMASRPSQPGVTPGAYAQPSGAAALPASRTTGQQDQTFGQAQPAAGAYSGAGAYGGAALPDASAAGASGPSDAASASIYPETNPAGAYAAADAAAGSSSAPPPSSAPGAVIEPTATTPPDQATVSGDGAASSSIPETTNPAATSTSSAASGEVISNPYSLPSSPPATTRPPSNPTPTTTPTPSTAPFTAPSLPSSLSGSPGGYRPGSTASPGSRYGAGSTIYEPSTAASGTGYSTPDGTIMR